MTVDASSNARPTILPFEIAAKKENSLMTSIRIALMKAQLSVMVFHLVLTAVIRKMEITLTQLVADITGHALTNCPEDQ